MNTAAQTGLRLLTLLCLAAAPLAAQQTAAAPQAQPPKQMPGYIIGPNDVLQVNVFSGGNSQPDFRAQPYTVQVDGSITLPLIKPIVVGGLSVTAADNAVRKALLDAKQFVECTVDIVVMGYHSSNIKVQGAVRNQGSIPLTAERMNISDALNAAGGLQPSAGSRIKVLRFGDRAPEPDVQVEEGWEIYSREDLNSGKLIDVQLYDGDTIDVPVAPKFFVQGFVTTAGEFQWEPNLTLEVALLKAGGVNKDGAKNRIKVRRMDPKTKEYKEIKLAKDKMSTIIEANDIIEVPKRRM